MEQRSSASRWIVAISIVAIASATALGLVLRTPDQPAPTAVPLAASSRGGADVAGTSKTPAVGTPSSVSPPAAHPSSPAHASSLPVATTDRHVWWIVLENHEYGSIVGSQSAPYINGLIARYGLATRYYAIGHPSEPNYVALVAGSTLGVTNDGVYRLARPSLFSQLHSVGRTWRVYAQDVPSECFGGVGAQGSTDGPGAAGSYARKHNPAISFASIADDPSQCRLIEPLRAFDPGAAPFEMIVPNLTNDMHDGTIRQGDAFLHAFLPGILASSAFRTGGVLFVTFDEGSSNAGSLGDHGGHVATLIISRTVAHGFRYRAYADHWTLLRTTEDLLGLPCLGEACRRSAMIRP